MWTIILLAFVIQLFVVSLSGVKLPCNLLPGYTQVDASYDVHTLQDNLPLLDWTSIDMWMYHDTHVTPNGFCYPDALSFEEKGHCDGVSVAIVSHEYAEFLSSFTDGWSVLGGFAIGDLVGLGDGSLSFSAALQAIAQHDQTIQFTRANWLLL
jgi:hypothetical protein